MHIILLRLRSDLTNLICKIDVEGESTCFVSSDFVDFLF
jgi:hypothetical protein